MLTSVGEQFMAKKRRVEISIQKGLGRPLPRTWLRRAVLKALDAALPNQACHVSLALCDDATIQSLNREYRGLDQVTDVLAFSSQYPGPWQGEAETHSESDASDFCFPALSEDLPDLGEVVVSYAQAQRQAAEARHGVERETALLVVHGVLHLLGYDHQEEKERDVMWKLQEKALKDLSL